MYIVSERDSKLRGKCERTRGESERGVQKAENKRDRNLKATMKQSIKDLKNKRK